MCVYIYIYMHTSLLSEGLSMREMTFMMDLAAKRQGPANNNKKKKNNITMIITLIILTVIAIYYTICLYMI